MLGESIFTQHPIVYLGVASSRRRCILRRTSAGLSVRAAGEKPGALDAAGVNVTATRTWATLVRRRARRGLGGGYLSIAAPAPSRRS